MEEKNKTKIENSKNATANSKINAGQNVHIGDIVHNIYSNQKDGNETINKNNRKNKAQGFVITMALIIIATISISVWYFNIAEKNNTLSENSTPIPAIDNDTSTVSKTVSIKPTAGNSEKYKPEQTANSSIKEKQKPIYFLNINGLDSDLHSIAQTQIRGALGNSGIILSTTKNNANHEIRCTITKSEKHYEVGIRPIIEVEFSMNLSVVNPETGTIKSIYQTESGKLKPVHSQSDIPKSFKNWLGTALGKIPPIKD